MHWEAVIGLEVHVQLFTCSKMFAGASTAYGAEPNTQACAVSIALPGVLPVANKEAIRLAIKFGLSIGAKINKKSIFARKNYFYPDLPKGYQISQFELPIVGKGAINIEIDSTQKTIGITRAHLEEDAGKSLHEDFHGLSGIDLNRAGMPLLEIVSEPDMRSATEAVTYLKKLHALVRHLGISDGNMQEGSFRCDANVSIRPMGEAKLGIRAELKNINSFRFVEKAINHEIERQIEIKENDDEVVQETRLYDSDKDETRSMRSKEEAHDYRYFPDPDLPPLIISESFIYDIKAQLPELPEQKKQRFIEQFKIEKREAELLNKNRDLADYFEVVCNSSNATEKTIVNWILGDLLGALNHANLSIKDCPITPQRLADLLNKIEDSTLSGKLAKEVFQLLWDSEKSVETIIEEKGLKQITDCSQIELIVDEVLAENTQQIKQYQSGNTKVLGFLVGQIMKKSLGKANPKQVNELLRKKLD